MHHVSMVDQNHPQNLALSKLKSFAEDKYYSCFVFDRLENIERKGENAV